jgi:hypothetical protein
MHAAQIVGADRITLRAVGGQQAQQSRDAEPGSVLLGDQRINAIPPALSHRVMFVVTESDAAIRTAYEREGELSAAGELRRLFPGIRNNDHARACARTIAGWQPLPVRPARKSPVSPRV